MIADESVISRITVPRWVSNILDYTGGRWCPDNSLRQDHGIA